MNLRIEEINKELEKISQTNFRKERMQNHLIRNESKLQRMRMDLRLLEKSIINEERDVIRLEQLTVSSLFLKILGSIEKQLEIERQEYLMEILKYNELLDSITLLEFEQQTLKNAIQISGDINQNFDRILSEKERFLKTIDIKFAIKIRLLDQKIDYNINWKSKMAPTLEHGKEALKILSAIKRDLSKVKEWGSWQYYGAGNYSAYAKKSYIDKARKNAIKADLSLEHYENDLLDLFKALKIPNNLRLDKFELFLRVFYDNLITDWIVQKHIKNALQNIQMNIDKVIRLQSTIQMEQKKVEKTVKQMRSERKKLIIEA